MRVDEIYPWGSPARSGHVYGTTDVRHPLIAEMHVRGKACVSGLLKGVALPLAGCGFVDTTRIAASAEAKVIVPIRAARGCPSMRCPYATAI